ncbi:LysR substrate-binding domain-containing protein [Acuticoccus sp. M5D2P5]|uniref:LysR substrate-binding domain-containing protein n=1 Tax=Acuticoccus kalidii TaxID=2910977 RepID=UPI001F3352EC|nr:LysR substrate-binding domain-containing protein [Acuticoccus kalidii]MCF3932373.1 LysR substrate-binding domain-containing protein [Acuticoccus kalidii]
MQLMLDSELIRTFVAICDKGSFRAAADEVHRTPSAISMQMSKLEEQIGTPLFLKNGRSVALTPAGEELLGYGRRILQLNEEALARFRGPKVDGKVRFGAPDDYGTRLLPRILARFAKLCPQVEVEVILAPTIVLLDRLDKGEIDITLTTSDGKGDGGRGGEIVHTEQLIWVGCAGGTAKSHDPLPLALSGPGCVWRHAALDALERRGRHHRVAFTSEHSQGQIAALRADLAIAPLPVSLLGPGLEAIGPSDGLPELATYDVRLCIGRRAENATKTLAQEVRDSMPVMLAA